jgi:uncharacterized damage-inducible protein DinB
MSCYPLGVELFDVEPLPGHYPEIGLMLSAIQDSTREWRGELGDVSEDAIVWLSADNGHSIGALLLHMIDTESYWFEQFCAGAERDPEEVKLLMSDAVLQDDAQWPVPPRKPLSWYYDLQDQIRERSFEALKGIDPERKYRKDFYACTLRWVVAHVLEHDSYTGGQAVLVHEIWKKR